MVRRLLGLLIKILRISKIAWMLLLILGLLRWLLKKISRIRWNVWVLLLILGLLGTSIWILTPNGSSNLDREKENLGMRLGLDLAGGSHLLYQVDFQEDWSDDERAFHMDRAVITIRDRIDKYGVAEPIIQQQGDDRILVQLPGITDREEARELIEQTGFLGFREIELDQDGIIVTLNDYLDSPDRLEFFDDTVEGNRIFAPTFANASDETIATFSYLLEKDDEGLKFMDADGNPVGIDIETLEEDQKALYSWMPAVGTLNDLNDVKEQLTGAYLTEALPWYPQTGTTGQEISVVISWNEEGTKLFDDITKSIEAKGEYNTPKRALGIFLDNELISAPQVFPPTMTEESYGSEATITGDFTWEEARLLAIQLDAGALDMPLEKPPKYERTVSATLGADFINKAVLAGVIGLGLIILFVILYYRLPGVLASLSLLVYVGLVLAIFKLIPVTLTLAGLAGFILSIGMAVDANVLIFERLKEELREGRTVKAAVETGFNRAWTAIRDSNISTFIICGILYWFGSSIVDSPPVMGFAVTLAIGVAVSMFSAIVITRTFLRFSTGARAARNPKWFGVEVRNV